MKKNCRNCEHCYTDNRRDSEDKEHELGYCYEFGALMIDKELDDEKCNYFQEA